MQKWSQAIVLAASAACVGITGTYAIAQEAGPATQPSGGGPSVIVPASPTTMPTTQLSLNFKDASIDAVLEYLSNSAGFIVLKEVPISGRVTVFSKQPVSPEEAVNLLNSVLTPNGYTAIQMERILKITTRDKAITGNIPVRFGADPSKVAQTDQLITQVIPVRSMDAVRLKADLQPMISATALWSANGSSNSLVMTDTSANIRRVVEIVYNMDKRDETENTIKVKQLKYADASAAAKLIQDIFKADDTSTGGGNRQNGNPFAGFGGFGGGGGGGGGGGRGGQGGGGGGATDGSTSGRTGRVTASSDQRTNTVVVTGPAATLATIEKMLTELDANPAAEQGFFIYPLKNGQAATMATVLNNLFGNTSGNRGTTGTNTRTSTGATGGTRTGATGGTTAARGGTTGGTTGGFSLAGGTAGTRGGTTTGGGGVSSAVAGAASALAGEVLVVADTDTNSLLVSTASKYEAQVRQIIQQLDRSVPQVLIKVLIAEVTHNASDDIGLDFSVLNLRASGNGQSGGTNFGAPVNGLVVSVLESNVQATLHALATAGKVEVLSRPYILASDNQLATITVGQDVPIITDSRLDVNNNPINQISYRNIGVILNVTPHINPEGLVICDVVPEVSSFSDVTVPISSTVSAPAFNLRSANTRVGIRNGETIVIGGLMEDRRTVVINKVPLLGDVPVLGLLFQRSRVTKAKTELLFFLTPQVAQSPAKLPGMTQDQVDGLKLVPGAVTPGVFEEHLRQMNRNGGSSTQPSTLPFVIPPYKPSTAGERQIIPEPELPGAPEKVPPTTQPQS